MINASLSIDADIAAVKARHDAAVRAHARAEQQRLQAQAAAEVARTQLRDQFGVDTVEQARTQLAELDHALAEHVSALRAALDEAGA